MITLLLGTLGGASLTQAQPTMIHRQLAVRPVVSGLELPTSLAFLGANDFLVLEKNTGKVKRVTNGVVQATVLDLNVNFGHDHGLLGIALHPDFASNREVYLYWTESTTGGDSDVLSDTPLLGNRVDSFLWDGATLTRDVNIILLRAIQDDGDRPRGNHDGGVIAFGADRKLYVFVGDVGRRGYLQNLPCGPTAICPGPTVEDDQFGGPEPDDAHFGGVVLRLNDDGSAPASNPFFAHGASLGGQVGANIQKIFTYGHRSSFGMALDPLSGNFWLQENGDDSFSELNRLEAGQNGGWIQICGPVSRIAQFKEIESTFGEMQLTQLRWPPSNIADTPQQALARLFVLPGSEYSDPEFAWKWEVAPAGMGFVPGKALGSGFRGDLLMGAATPQLHGGYLFRLELTADRRRVDFKGRKLLDRVADNLAKHEGTESERLLIGENFGVVTDIEPAPNGRMYVVSLTHGAVYEIYRRAKGTD